MELFKKSERIDGKNIKLQRSFFNFYFPQKCVENQFWKIERKIELSQDIVRYDRILV